MFEFKTNTWNWYDENWCDVFPDATKDIKKTVIYGFGLYRNSNNNNILQSL